MRGACDVRALGWEESVFVAWVRAIYGHIHTDDGRRVGVSQRVHRRWALVTCRAPHPLLT